jgi:hypothetical protein
MELPTSNIDRHSPLRQYLLLDTLDDRPSSLLECMDDNDVLNTEKYLQYSAAESERECLLLKLTLQLIETSGSNQASGQ